MQDEPEELTAEEISRRIVTALGLTYELFNEMHAFFRLIKSSLESSEAELDFWWNKYFYVPHGSGGKKSAAAYHLPTHMGFFANVRTEDEEEEESSDQGSGGNLFQVTTGTKLLAVHALLYDHAEADKGSFEPLMVAGVLSDLKRTPRWEAPDKSEAEQHFSLKRRQLLKGLRAYDSTVKTGARLEWLVPNYTVAGVVDAAVVKTLGVFREEAEVEAFVQKVVSMVENTPEIDGEGQ